MELVNPATELRSNFPDTPLSEIPRLFNAALIAYEEWRAVELSDRLKLIGEGMSLLRERLEEAALVITTEMGKPIRFSRMEIERAIGEIQFTLEHASEWLAPEPAAPGVVRFDPLGVTAVISPWNFPFMLPLRGIIPALVAGNTVLFKPSEITPQSGALIASLFDRLPKGVLTPIFGGRELGALLVQQPVALIAFTGSVAAGKHIAAQAGRDLKRVILELGGLDAAIVLGDANIGNTAKQLVQFNAQNSGQVCNAVKRVYVERKIYPELVAEIVEESKKLKLGDPLQESTDMGPLVSQAQFDRVVRFAEDAIIRGATVHSGGIPDKTRGFFFPHTVLSELDPKSALLTDEPFGPLLPIIPVDSIDEAVKLANGTPFGLMSSVWTENRAVAQKLASRLDSGLVGINTHRAGPPGTPWGGVKESGIGRMKTRDGFREFTNIKYVGEG